MGHELYHAPRLVIEKRMHRLHNLDERNATINTLRDAQGEGEGGANGEQVSDDEETTKALSPVAVDKDENPLKLRVVQQLPEFPGGMVEMMKWITRTLHYPYAAQKQKIEGRVLVTFIINRDGSIANIKVLAVGLAGAPDGAAAIMSLRSRAGMRSRSCMSSNCEASPDMLPDEVLNSRAT